MCMSPHEMSSARIEEDVAALRRYAEAARPGLKELFEARIEGLVEILKERADAGTY